MSEYKTVIVNFIGGKPLSLRIPATDATRIVPSLAAGPGGTSTITSDGRAYIINRTQITFITSEDE